MNRPRQNGFTIVELLVVLVIISVLIGLLYPALRGGILRAKKTSELNSIRQVGAAWALYSVANLDRLMPGYISTEVQERWDVAWAYPDESLIPPAPMYDDSVPNITGPWPWRLLEGMNNRWETLVEYKKRSWNSMQVTDHAEVIAVQPAFGYNGYYLGGYWELSGHTPRPKARYSQVLLEHGEVDNVVASVGSQITTPTKLVVFCSSFYAQAGEHRHLLDDTDGYFFAVPRILANTPQWEARDDGVEAFVNTNPPLGRYNGLPAVYFADGHVDDIPVHDLEDQKRWIPRARDLGNTPAHDFSHAE